jgi:ligand-binding sensor domain-containing protein
LPLTIILHRTGRYILLIFVFRILTLGSQTPHFNFQKLGSEEGLNNANIFGIEQHPNGLMYFSTQNGIYFYDGYNFEQLQIDSLKSNTLLNATVTDKERLFLSIRDEGISEYSLKSKILVPVPELKYKENNSDVFIINDRFAYLLTQDIKIVIIDLKTGQIIPDHLRNKNREMNLPYCILKTDEGRVLLGRTSGIYDITDGTHEQLDILKNMPVHALAQTGKGKLIAGTSGKIYIIDKNIIEKEITVSYKTRSTTFQPEGVKPINRILADNFGRIWFTSFPGENLYLYENNNLYDIFSVLGIPPALINCIYKDSRQNIWVGTFSEGVYFIQNSFFNSINFAYNNKNLNINEVFLKDNLLAVATSNGLYALNLKNNQSKALSKPDEVFTEPINGITLHDDVLYYAKRSQFDVSPSIFFDSKHTYKFKPVIAKQFYPLDETKSIIADWDANLLLSNFDGSKTNDTLISFSYRISVNAILKVDELLYIATNNGLFQYDLKSRKYYNLVRNELNFNINDLALINGKLYAAHEGGLTDVYERKLIQQVGKFRLNTVRKIKHFNDHIWLATLDGVFICDNDLVPVKTLNKSNGLLSNYVNDVAFNGNTVSIATARGVSTADFIDIIKNGSVLNPVTISHIICNGETISSNDNSFKFAADQEHITIFFYSPLFRKPNKQFFRYKINNSEWKYFNNLSFEITLSGGDHILDISASPDNLVWSDSTTIKIKKEEKFSEKKSVYLLLSLSGLFIISAFSYIRIRRVKSKAKKRLSDEQQVNLLKHQAMNSLLSPHFIFNSLTSIQNYINTNNGLRASEYLAKFSRLIRMIIEKAAQSQISLQDELARLTYYLELEKERFKDKFDYVINLPEEINPKEILIPNMIIQPYVENCILHGILPKNNHGLLTITFHKGPGKLFKIEIEDNGIGLIKASEHAKTGHKSIGTSTIQSILEINSKLSGKKQKVSMADKSLTDPSKSGTLIKIELEL